MNIQEIKRLLAVDFYSLSPKEVDFNHTAVASVLGTDEQITAFDEEQITKLFSCFRRARDDSIYLRTMLMSLFRLSTHLGLVTDSTLELKTKNSAFTNLASIIDDTRTFGRFEPNLRPLPLSSGLLSCTFSQYADEIHIREGMKEVLKSPQLSDDQAFLLLVSGFAIAKTHKPKERHAIASLIRTAPRYHDGESLGDFELSALELF